MFSVRMTSHLNRSTTYAAYHRSNRSAMRGVSGLLGRLGQALASPQVLVNLAPAKKCSSAAILRSTYCRAFASAGAAPNLEWVELLRDKDLFKQQCFIGGEWVDAGDGETIDVRIFFRRQISHFSDTSNLGLRSHLCGVRTIVSTAANALQPVPPPINTHHMRNPPTSVRPLQSRTRRLEPAVQRPLPHVRFPACCR